MVFKQNNEADDYHVFVSDSEWMRELGLSTFTTGTLYDWWYKKDEAGAWLNRPLIHGDPSEQSPSVFFHDDVAAIAPGEAKVWRFVGDNKGKYQEQIFDEGWTYTDGRRESEEKLWHGQSYDTSQVELDEFDGAKFTGDPIDPLIGLLAPERLGGILVRDGGIGEGFTTIPGPGITNIIALNDWVRDYEFKVPDKKTWTPKQLARYQFIEDIKTSKDGCLTFEVVVNFDVAPGQVFKGGEKAIKLEDFDIKLYLYDQRQVRNSGKTAIMSVSMNAGLPRDRMGRVGPQTDGELDEKRGENPGDKVAGEMDLTLSAKTGKWKSGSKQILAKIVQEVPSATWVANVEELESQTNADVLDDPEDPKHLVLGSGTAMPITMQNGNPMQWTPNYSLPKACRKEDKSKHVVIVHNPDPNKKWVKDKVVILNEIDDLWMPLDFGSGVPDVEPTTSSFEGRWDFMYFATSLEYFFRGTQLKSDGSILATNLKLTPDMTEKAFHYQYYNGDPDNWHASPSQSPHLYTRSAKILNAGHGYHQFSSFDFMDKYIGGTRGEKRSLGATVYGKDPLDNTINDPSPTTSGPFFGCVFPNGYKSADETSDRNGADLYSNTRNFSVQAKDHWGGKFFSTEDPVISDTRIPFDGVELGSAQSLLRHAYNESPSLPDTANPDIAHIVPMFAGVYNGDHSVAHLPADIALNCSPSGKYGRPLTDLGTIMTFFTVENNGGLPLQRQIRDVVFYNPKGVGTGAYRWLYKAKYWDGNDYDTVSRDSSAGTLYDKIGAADDSAFDFQPRTANKIQFRPLKAEVYASFVDQNVTALMVPDAIDNGRHHFWHHIRNKMNDGKKPASDVSRDRERWDYLPTVQNPLYMDGTKDWWQDVLRYDSWGLAFNVDYPESLFRSNDPSEHFSDSWDRTSNSWVHEQEPAGAVGVIGAVCSVSASTFINFITDQKFGMQTEFERSVTGTFGIGEGSWYTTTWGGASLGYDDFHTTDLSVKIYHAWPREQTVYDPRFFAVHHFNNGVSLLGSTPITTGIDTLGDGVPDHAIHVKETTVDTREPTYVLSADQEDQSTLNAPTSAPIGTAVFGDAIYDASNNFPLLSSGNWNINPIRRGKLLPFNYKYNRVALPWNEGDKLSIFGVYGFPQDNGVYFSGALPQTNDTNQKYIDDPTTEDVAEKKSPHDVDMVIQDLGFGYKIGDRFTVNGSDAILTVSSIRNHAVTSGNADGTTTLHFYTGSIDGLEYTSSGTYLDHSKLFKLSNQGDLSVAGMNLIKRTTQGSVQIKPLHSASTHGKSFKAYIVKGAVKEFHATDDKPQLGTSLDYFQLSLPAPNYKKEHNGIKPMVQGQRIVQAELDQPSVDGLYDCFFHFHNDISHTFFSAMDWGSKHNNEDQYIDLTITPV